MNHAELATKLLKAASPRPLIGFREAYSEFCAKKLTRFVMKGNWIKDHRIIPWAREHDHLCVSECPDGHWYAIEITGFGRVGHDT
jgi:hypothetical protein